MEDKTGAGKKEMIKDEWKTLVKGISSKETQDHLVKAGSEFLLALDSIFPQSALPEEARRHMRAMRKEFLLMAKSVIDSRLESLEKEGKPREMEKIDVE